MNRLPLFLHQRSEPNIFVVRNQDQVEHVKNVIRAQPGEQLKISLIDQGIGMAEVLKLTDCELIVRLIKVEPAPEALLCLLIGICRPPSMEKILEHATAAGVSQINFFCAELSDKSFMKSRVLREENIQKKLLDGLAQSATWALLPKVSIHQSLKLALKNLPDIESRFLLSPGAAQWFYDYPQSPAQMLAIGPERGFTIREEKLLAEYNFLPVTIAQSVLRVEMAVFHAQSQLEMLRSGYKLLSQKISDSPLR
jgi:RsmE family RNA methyltransferase